LALEFLYADKLDEFYETLAYHFSSGEDYPKAYQYLKFSGKKAEANFSHLEAFQFLEKALRHMTGCQKGKEAMQKARDLRFDEAPHCNVGLTPKDSLRVLTEVWK